MQQQSEYPLVAVPRLADEDFMHGEKYGTHAKHPMAGYGSFIISAYGVTFFMQLVDTMPIKPSAESVEIEMVFVYSEPDCDMYAFIGAA